MDNAEKVYMQAVVMLSDLRHGAYDNELIGEGAYDILKGALDSLFFALRAQAEREKPPVALTLEQLEQRHGKPVYCVAANGIHAVPQWGIVDVDAGYVDLLEDAADFGDCGVTWQAYDRPPERGA